MVMMWLDQLTTYGIYSGQHRGHILSTVMTVEEGADINALYDKSVSGFVVDYDGNKVEDAVASKIDLVAEWKKVPKSRKLPVYEFRSASDPSKVEFVVLPVYGYGLWNEIWGYVALQSDFNTVQGVKFDHKQETPGLGARIKEAEVQARFYQHSL